MADGSSRLVRLSTAQFWGLAGIALAIVLLSPLVLSASTFRGRDVAPALRLLIVVGALGAALYIVWFLTYGRGTYLRVASGGRVFAWTGVGWKDIGPATEAVITVVPKPGNSAVVLTVAGTAGDARRELPSRLWDDRAKERASRHNITVS